MSRLGKHTTEVPLVVKSSRAVPMLIGQASTRIVTSWVGNGLVVRPRSRSIATASSGPDSPSTGQAARRCLLGWQPQRHRHLAAPVSTMSSTSRAAGIAELEQHGIQLTGPERASPGSDWCRGTAKVDNSA
jgi:hypothetical protein